MTDVPVVTRTAVAAQHRCTQQHNHHEQEQRTEQAMQEGERDQREEEEKGQEERERGEKGREAEKERDVEEEEREQVKKDVTGWTVVTRSTKHRKRTVQIFVKVDGGKTSAMEMEMSDKVDDIVKKIPISDQDVYVTSGGRILRRSDKLESCEVRDGSTIQVTSRLRGGGKHKDKKSKVEKKQASSEKTPEQKFVEEVSSDKSPVIRECDKDATVTRQESMSDVNQETQEKNEDKMIQVLDEDSMKSWVEFWSKESDNEVGQKMENWMSVLQGVKEVDVERANIWKCGMRWAVGARRKQRRQQVQEQRRQQEQEQKQWRQDEQEQRESSGRQSKGKTQDRSKVSKASKCVSMKKNGWKRCERKTLKR